MYDIALDRPAPRTSLLANMQQVNVWLAPHRAQAVPICYLVLVVVISKQSLRAEHGAEADWLVLQGERGSRGRWDRMLLV